MGKGGTTIQAPPQVDAAQAQGEYLFGSNFGDFQGVTDPRLVQRIIGAERMFRPEFAALELADIGTFARGLEGRANPEYQRIQSQIESLRAGGEVADAQASEEQLRQFRIEAESIYPADKRANRQAKKERKENIERYIKEKSSGGVIKDTARAEKIAELQAQLANTPKRLGKSAGLFDLLEESSERAFDLQQFQLGKQREADVAALQRFAKPVVDAYRAADPASTRLAELASARAGQATNIGKLGEFLMGTAMDRTKDPSALESQLAQIGLERGDLSPTEQEALISGRGTEFIQSTGELSPLEQRRVQQSARQASLARGRELGQGALAQEIANRFAEESGKREREIALGAQLLGQEAGLRGARLGQGAGILTQAEALAAQRRAEELQRFQLGAGLVGREEGIQSGRFGQAFGMNRALAGDAGNIILGRPSAAIGLGQQTLGQAQQGAAGPMGPQLFDPNLGINMALQNQQNQFGLLGAQAQADATRSAGFMQGLGSALGAFNLPCWVAREVYGIENPKWVQFRNWMLNDSPSWFRKLYIKYGERFAKFISNKPVFKNIIRKWMNTKIK